MTSKKRFSGKRLDPTRRKWEKSWKRLQRSGRSKAKAIGIKSERDIERLIDEGRA